MSVRVHIINPKLSLQVFLFFCLSHLDESDPALTCITVGVFDGNLSVVLDPALSAENVVDAGRHFVPFIVVSESEQRNQNKIIFSSYRLRLFTNRWFVLFVFFWLLPLGVVTADHP